MDLTEFWTICATNNIVLDKEQMKRIERYAGELFYWNERVNMVSRKDIDNLLENHILHSLSILKYFKPPYKARCLDAGTGGGLPGIPVAIARPDIHMMLVDSIAKKMKITSMMAKHTGLKHLTWHTGRVENLSEKKELTANFDLILARAVKGICVMIDWTKPLLKSGGNYIFLKGGDLEEEKDEAQKKYNNLSIKEHNIKLPGAPRFEKEKKKILVCSFE